MPCTRFCADIPRVCAELLEVVGVYICSLLCGAIMLRLSSYDGDSWRDREQLLKFIDERLRKIG